MPRRGLSPETRRLVRSERLFSPNERAEEQADAPRWAQAISDERDPQRKLELFAAWTRAFFSASRDVIEAAHRRASAAESAAESERRRRAAVDNLIAVHDDPGVLRKDISREKAADRAWILTGPELSLLAAKSDWSPAAYQDWLAELLSEQIPAERACARG